MRCRLWLTSLLLFPAVAAAQDSPRRQPVQELFFTEVVYPQSRHELQLTLGTFVDRASSDKSALTPFSIEFGISDRLQVEAAWDGYSHFHASPLGHLRTARTSVGAKYSVMNIGGAPIHAAFGLDVEFPRSDVFPEGEGEAGTEFEPFLALALDIGRAVTVFGSGTLSLSRSDVTDTLRTARFPDDPGTISGGALIAVHRITLAGEYTSRSDQAPWRLGGSPLVTPSLIVHPGGEWEVGLGLPVGVRRGARRPGLALHVVKEF